MYIDLSTLLSGTRTYPSWYSSRTYELITIPDGEKLLVTYNNLGGKKPRRYFPRYIEVTNQLIWAIGFIEGEGSNSIGSSAYRRFMVTNSNPEKMLFILDVLEQHKLITRKQLPKHSIRVRYGLHHDKKRLVRFWLQKLRVKKENIYLSTKADPLKRSKYGVCDIYVSDVILRLVTDKIRAHIFDLMKRNIKATI